MPRTPTRDPDVPTQYDLALLALSQKTGLSTLTLDDLARNGWVFVESLNQPRRFVDPTANLRVR